MRLVTASRQLIVPQWNVVALLACTQDHWWHGAQIKAQTIGIKRRMPAQHRATEAHQHLFQAIEAHFGIGLGQFEPRLHFFVEVFQQDLAGVQHGVADFAGQVELQLFKGLVNFLGLAAALIDVRDAALEIDTRFDRPQDLVTGAEHTVEQTKLDIQQFIDATVGIVIAVEEIDHHHIVLLAIAMATADALFDALRVPGQVVVDDQRTELQIDTFGAGLGGDHDAAGLTEVVDQGSSGIGAARAADAPGTLVPRQPVGIDTPRLRVAIAAVKQHHALAKLIAGQQREQVVLGATRFGKDNRLLGRAQFAQAGKGDLQSLQERQALGVLGNGDREITEVFELDDFGLNSGDVIAALTLGFAIAFSAAFIGGLLKRLVVPLQFITQRRGGFFRQRALQATHQRFQGTGDGERAGRQQLA